MEKEKVLKAGEIAKQVIAYAKSIIKKDASLLEIAEKIESKIVEFGGRPAFPTNLAINEVAAHYTPAPNDEAKAHGLLKVDLGVHVDGWAADTAFSLDLDKSEENKKLIETAEAALQNALELVEQEKGEATTSDIGKVIQTTIENAALSPIINLSGHSMEQYELHAGVTIPNIDNTQNMMIEEGLYAIEPFTTTGNGRVKDGRPSGIYSMINSKTPRNPKAREIIKFVESEYQTLPFCTRWIVKKFGQGATLALKQLEENGNLHHFAQLIEVSGAKVAQAEHTVLVEKDKATITTK